MKNIYFKLSLQLALALLSLAIIVAPLRAGEMHYLSVEQPDGVALLGPPPNSVEQAADLVEVTAVHNAGDSSEKKEAWREQVTGPTLSLYTPIIGSFFQPEKLPKTKAFFHRVRREVDMVVNRTKSNWNRPRPYVIDPKLLDDKPIGVKPADGFSYPSGHATDGIVDALLLAKILPDKSDAILAEGYAIGWHRVFIAQHYPTDVFAGRVLGRAIVCDMEENPDFQKDLAEVKAEIAAAQK